MKRLYRSETDEVLGGVIGGFGEYFSIDPTVLRIGYVLFVLLTGIFPGIIAYIVAFIIIPERAMVGSHTPKEEAGNPREQEVAPEEKVEPMTHIKDVLEQTHGDIVPAIMEKRDVMEVAQTTPQTIDNTTDTPKE